MNRFLITIAFILASPWLWGQTNIDTYQYWFNSNTTEAVTQSIGSPSTIYTFNNEIETSGLPNGLHTFHIRFRDSEERWSSALSQFFYKVPLSTLEQNKLVAYEYWFNNNYSSAIAEEANNQTTFTINEQVGIGSLPNGLHTFHIRFKDSRDHWSSALSQFFYKVPETSFEQNKLIGYEYWFNQQRDNAVDGALGNQPVINFNEELDASNLTNGLHTLHIRFKDSNGQWSNTVSQFFYKVSPPTPTENLIQMYRYWFNELEGETIEIHLETPVNPYQLVASIEPPFLNAGGHTVHFQFKDTQGQWSVVMTDEFEIETCQPGYINTPKGDSEVCQGSTTSYTVDAALNITHIEWSLSPTEAGVLQADDRTVQIVWSESFAGEATLEAKGSNPCGETEGKSLTVNVISNPAVKAMDDSAICIGESIDLQTISNVGTIEWDVPSTTVWPTENTTYVVTATTQCGTATDEVTITVNSNPTLTVMADDEICHGDQITLTATSNGTVTWDVDNTTVSPTETTTYTATASLNGCQVSDGVTVEVKPLPTLEVMADDEICYGDEITLIATSNGTVTWDVENTTVSPTETTTYTATASLNGCEVSDGVTVEVKPLPTLEVMADEEICLGDQITLTATSNGTVTWDVDNTTVSPTENTTYTATASLNGCQVSDGVTVEVKPLPTLEVMADEEICHGDQITLIATSNGTVTWDVDNTTVSPTETTTYTATASLNGCEVSDGVTVEVKPLPTLEVMADEEICLGDQITLTATSNGTVTWDVDNTTVSPTENTTYVVTATTQCGTATDEVTITVNSNPTLTVMADEEICLGDQITLTATSNGTVTWDVDNTTVSPSKTTTYTATASLNGCQVSDGVTVEVKPLPTLEVMADDEICHGDQITLTATSNGTVTWDVDNTTVSPTETTTYTATASLNGCQVSDGVTITVNPTYEFVDNEQICKGEILTWRGNEYTEAGTYFDQQQTVAGCDSIFVLNLSVIEVDVTVTLDNESLVANATDASYQWLACNGDYQPIEGQVNQIFTPTSSGSYAVEVTQNGCSAISECYFISISSSELELLSGVNIYPNPTSGHLNINFEEALRNGSISVYNIGGQLVKRKTGVNEISTHIDLGSFENGVYIIEIHANDMTMTFRVIKSN